MSKVDKIFKQLPNELKNKILKEMTLTPNFTHKFSKRLSPKTKNQVLTCKQVIEHKNWNETEKLKELKILIGILHKDCSRNDIILTIHNKHEKIFNYLNNHYNNIIDINDLVRYIYLNSVSYTEILLKYYNKKWEQNDNETLQAYAKLFTFARGSKPIIKLLFKYSPSSRKFPEEYLSLAFSNNLNVPGVEESLKNTLSIGKTDNYINFNSSSRRTSNF